MIRHIARLNIQLKRNIIYREIALIFKEAFKNARSYFVYLRRYFFGCFLNFKYLLLQFQYINLKRRNDLLHLRLIRHKLNIALCELRLVNLNNTYKLNNLEEIKGKLSILDAIRKLRTEIDYIFNGTNN